MRMEGWNYKAVEIRQVVYLATAESVKIRKEDLSPHWKRWDGGVSQVLETCLIIYLNNVYPVPIFARPCSYLSVTVSKV